MDSPLTPVFYKINRPILSDDSTIKASQVRVPSSENQNETNLGPGQSLTFTYNGCSSLVSVNSLKSGFYMSFSFKTKARAAAAAPAADAAPAAIAAAIAAAAAAPYTDKHDADVTLINNFWAHMFSMLSVANGSTQLEKIDHFGVVYDALCLIENPDFISLGSNAGFELKEKDRKLRYNYPVAGNAVYRTLDIFVPLRFMSGFCNSFNRLTSNFSYTFMLTRSSSVGSGAGKVWSGAVNTSMEIKLDKIELFLETIEPKTALKVEYLKAIEKEVDVAYTAYMCRRDPNVASQSICVREGSCSNPRYIIVLFRGINAGAAGAGSYINADVRKFQHEISDNMFPAMPQDCNFSQNKISKFYNDLLDLAVKENRGIVITVNQFKNLYPLFGCDVSARQMPTDNSPINIVTNIERGTPDAVDMFIIYAYERKVKLNMINNSASKN